MGWFVFKSILFAISLFTPFVAIAQTSQMTPNQQLLRAEELDSLIAPIALYPDTLLAEMLMASTYPVEIVQAERWLKENKKLKDAELKAAVDKQAWDETVKSMVAAPSVLTMMSTRLDWTQRLGDAVLAQQPDVMDAIQRLRSKAKANKKLSSDKEQKVTVTQDQNKEIIVIEPTDPEIIYVPYYDPLVVYGGWYYPAYPPYYFPPPVHVSHPIMLAGIAFGAGYILGRWGSGGNYWGGGINWSNNNININRPRVNPLSGSNWQHRPEHRQGVRYNNASVQQRFGNNNFRSGSQQRMEFRGRGGEQKPQPVSGTQRPGAGQKSGAATSRPAVGDRAKSGLGAAGQLSRGTNDLGRGDAFSSITNPSGLGGGNAFGNIQSGRTANLQSQRGHASVGSGGFRSGGGGGGISAGGGGGFRGGGGGGRGGGGRRSDIRLKHDVTLLGHLDNGLGFYRFVYNGGDKAYVGVMAQEVQIVEPEAVVTGRDGFLRVFYHKLGLKLQTYDEWMASGARLPSTTQIQH